MHFGVLLPFFFPHLNLRATVYLIVQQEGIGQKH